MTNAGDTPGKPPEFELVVRFGGWSRRFCPTTETITIGRSSSCDLPLLDPSVSRVHCRIWKDGDAGWQVEDTGSTAKTILNGSALDGAAALEHGALLELSSTTIRVVPSGESKLALSGDLMRDTSLMDQLLQAMGKLVAAEDFSGLLKGIVAAGIDVAGGERGALYIDTSGGGMEVALALDRFGDELPAEEMMSRSLPAKAIETQRAVVVIDALDGADELSEGASVFRQQLRSVICIPLPGAGEIAGVLYVDSRQPASALGTAERAMLEALAAHAALAIQQSKLHRSRTEALERENETLRARIGQDVPIGDSPQMQECLEVLHRAARSEVTVCIQGETGTGKELLARRLHLMSHRAESPFVVVDCGALPEHLIESELFGHEKGAFTGAETARRGRFREAEGGTIFLDEVGDLPLSLQPKLLRVLQNRTVQPVGSDRETSINVRVVSATHRDLEKEVKEGRFRQDLFYRLTALPIVLPPLREREGDVQLLAAYFLGRLQLDEAQVHGLTREAELALRKHDWPGNVRELEHRLQRALVLARTPFVTEWDLGLGKAPAVPSNASPELQTMEQAREDAMERFERGYLHELLERTEGRVQPAAELAGITRQSLHRLLKRRGIDRKTFGN